MDTTPQYKKQYVEAFKDIGFVFNGIKALPNLLIVDDDELLVSWATSEEMIQEEHGFAFTIYGQLYRQDQLQEVIVDKFSSFEQIPGLARIADFKRCCMIKNLNPATWEVLWLAFVMHEKFGKTWDSDKEKWVKE